MDIKNFKLPSEIKVKPKIADFVNAIPPGESVLFNAVEYGPVQSARAAVTRANRRIGQKAYSLVTEDNGVTYVISRTV